MNLELVGGERPAALALAELKATTRPGSEVLLEPVANVGLELSLGDRIGCQVAQHDGVDIDLVVADIPSW